MLPCKARVLPWKLYLEVILFSGLIMLIGAEAALVGLAGLECRLWGGSPFALPLIEVNAKETPLTSDGAIAP